MPATEQIWRPLSTLHKVFAGSAIALLAATIVMVDNDEDREWRQYQIEAEELRDRKLAEELADLKSGPYLTELEELRITRNQAETEFLKQADEYGVLQNRLAELNGLVELLEREVKFQNAEVGVSRANRDIDVRDAAGDEQLVRRQADFESQNLVARNKQRELDVARAERDAVKNQLAALKEDLDLAEAEIASHQQEVERIEEQIRLLRPDALEGSGAGGFFAALKRDMKRWPIINGFNPEIKIVQDWLPDLKQQLGMARVARFDRCRSCHVHIDRFASGNVPEFPKGTEDEEGYPNPFCSHPQPELFLTATSPHPLTEFGCTSCHEGDGSGTSFQTAEHTPSNPIEAHEWEDEYGWHSNHFWEYPMHPSVFAQTGCLKCHPNVTELGVNETFGATAPKLYEGYELVKEYGCFGCHEINGYDGTEVIGPDLRLEPQTAEEAAKIAADPNQVAGDMRKVGPSLRHLASKTTPEFVRYWTEEPKRFREHTRMPQFFDLTNQQDHLAGLLQPVELAGLTAYLMERSEEMQLMQPQEGYEPDAERGKIAFSRRGCLACHQHDDPYFDGIDSDFGPNLTKVHEKIQPGPDGFNWLYTWLNNPELHHPRTKMPNLFLTPEGEGENYVDPAADIAAFLLQGGPREFPSIKLPGAYVGIEADENFTEEMAISAGIESGDGARVKQILAGSPAERAAWADGAVADNAPALMIGDIIASWNGSPVRNAEHLEELASAADVGERVTLTRVRGGRVSDVVLVVSTPLEDLARLYLSKQATAEEVQATLELGYFVRRRGVVAPDGQVEFVFEEASADSIKGDEIELVHRPGDGEELDAEERNERLLLYVGRRTISRYGCYGCHEIPGYEDARPIGTQLQDWGRKDTSKLAFEHVAEWLHHHGEPDGGSTHERISEIVNPAYEEQATHQEKTAAYFYESLLHHKRPGFLWQKLRQPRSYDYEKIGTKGWDERLRMPRFPFDEDQIESIATFVLGLVADPPIEQYVYQPEGPAKARIEGERLLAKYNCASCHMLEMEGFRFEADLDELIGLTRTELVHWIGERAEVLASGDLLQPVLLGRSLTPEEGDYAPPPGIPESLAERLQAQAQLETDRAGAELDAPSLDGFLRAYVAEVDAELSEEAAEEAEASGPPLILPALEEYYRELFGGIADPSARKAAIEREREIVDHVQTFLLNSEELLAGRLVGVSDVTLELTPVLGGLVDSGASDFTSKVAALQEWLDRHPEVLLADRIPDPDVPESVRRALEVKPPVAHPHTVESSAGSESITIHGLTFAAPDPEEEDPEFREYSFDLWENYEVGGRYKLTGVNGRYIFNETAVEEQIAPRGGDLAQWLVPRLADELMQGDRSKAWQAAPPPLYKEGVKVQTPWLYRFLKNPDQIRYTTVLRMPRFNMSDDEAQALANYFAAVDGAPFPYQRIPEQDDNYLAERNAEFHEEFPDSENSYLEESWLTLNGPLCIKCHALGGRPYQASDPKKDIRGPNLQRVAQRMQPDWLHLWIYKPAAIVPYTSMPSNFPKNQSQFPDLFGGQSKEQTEAVVDALINYHLMMETFGETAYVPPTPPEGAPDAEDQDDAETTETSPDAGG
ncbi:MAG: hypothetical protein DWQ34_11090 [Planctomycetota bacterium]|nr:MAG: hypothetical protein DWQ34_11090 [Planctomycetota bacterium]REK22558.1 MAG: hypothetical protein DWQ41_18905 [Planctomycetota bacterium]REK36020.1 MAG: hypothetical protein DWQ45_10050 [Planctomycetota bacterium]